MTRSKHRVLCIHGMISAIAIASAGQHRGTSGVEISGYGDDKTFLIDMHGGDSTDTGLAIGYAMIDPGAGTGT